MHASVSPNFSEAAAQRCSVKKVFLEISQNPQEYTSTRVSFLIKLQTEACNFIKKETLARFFPVNFTNSKNNFSYRTPPVAASVFKEIFLNIMSKRIDTNSRFKVNRKTIPSTRSNIRYTLNS